jgi:hypothetical protein
VEKYKLVMEKASWCGEVQVGDGEMLVGDREELVSVER